MYKIFGCDCFSKYFLLENASKWSKNTKKSWNKNIKKFQILKKNIFKIQKQIKFYKIQLKKYIKTGYKLNFLIQSTV